MIKPSDFEVTYIKELTSREHEFVHKFWEFADGEDLNQFAHTITSLDKEFFDIKIKRSHGVAKLIMDLAYISCPQVICPQCNQTIKFNNRHDLKYVSVGYNFLCDPCHDQNLQNVLQKSLEFVDYFVNTLKFPDSEFDVNSLNYFEQIYLLIILERSNPSGYFELDSEVVSEETDQNLIFNLQEKRIIFHLHSQIEIVSELLDKTHKIEKNINHLDRDQRLKFALLSNKIPKRGMYLYI